MANISLKGRSLKLEDGTEYLLSSAPIPGSTIEFNGEAYVLDGDAVELREPATVIELPEEHWPSLLRKT